ncbi:hypothetical protein FRB91_008039 [Serendipita sp. 411]|nr:hypothetical protein FRB91_008039 [Serendipita sp. 411]
MSLQSEQEALATHIAFIRASDPPILRVPNEILHLIFDYILHDAHPEIRTILLVCKRWHEAASKPRFWTRLQISVEAYPNFELLGMWTRYISACVHRSCDLPLAVSLDFERFSTGATFIAEQIEDCLHEFLSTNEISMIKSYVAEDIDGSMCTLYFDRVMDLVDLITGEERTNMKRWKYLRLLLPTDSNAAQEIWWQLTGPTPLLTELVLENATVSDYETTDIKELVLPNLGALQTLIIKTSTIVNHTRPSELAFVPPTLEHLEMSLDHGWFTIDDLRIFTNLVTLKICIPHQMTAVPWEPPSLEPTYPLPRLRKLTVVGNLTFLPLLSLDVPSLEELHIVRHNPLNLDAVLHVSPKRVNWNVAKPYRKEWTTDALRSALRAILSEYRSATEITIHGFAQNVALELMAPETGGQQ